MIKYPITACGYGMHLKKRILTVIELQPLACSEERLSHPKSAPDTFDYIKFTDHPEKRKSEYKENLVQFRFIFVIIIEFLCIYLFMTPTHVVKITKKSCSTNPLKYGRSMISSQQSGSNGYNILN